MAFTFIAHRGNIKGPDPANENRLDYLMHTYTMGFAIECDLIGYKNGLYFGHDEPQELADPEFLRWPDVYCHAKNLEAVKLLSRLHCHWFWHQQDDITLTSKGYLWCYPGKYIDTNGAIFLDLEPKRIDPSQMLKYSRVSRICGDYYDPWEK